MQPIIINKFGKIAGWSSLRVTMLNRVVEGITKIEYDDDQEMNNEYGVGVMPIGQSDGNYNARCVITLYAEEIIALQESLPPGMRIQDIPAFPIIPTYEFNTRNVTDVINNCRIRTVGKAYTQGDGKSVHDCQVLTSHIDWHTTR